MLSDTICAISTNLKESAISIIRLSGDESFDLIKKISDIKIIQPNTISYAHIYENNEVVDEVLISIFKSPKSYTREDIVEINSHGGIFVTRRILNLLLSNGARLAEPGEFTKRAYLNGRINLTEAESINDLINARNILQSKSAIRGINGSIKKILDPLMEDIKNVISMIEVNIDYPEYDDVEKICNSKIKPKLEKWIIEINDMINKAERFRIVKDGLITAIIGKPNVGKSSLLNALLEEDKAIVTEIAGTTRDLVEGVINLESISLKLIDTAGLRETNNEIEEIGIKKTRDVIENAELIILVIDASNITDEDKKLIELTDNKNRIIVYNKIDLNNNVDGIKISAKNNNISELIDYIENKYKNDSKLVDENILNNERQISLMKKVLNELMKMKNEIDLIELDVIELNLEEAYHYLCEIIGIEYKEDLIDHLFKNFCLGK